MGYQFCSKNCEFSIENYSIIFRQNTNTEGAKMGYFHVTLTVLLSIAILFAMTFHEASAGPGCGPDGCPPGMKCVMAPPSPFVPIPVYYCKDENTKWNRESSNEKRDWLVQIN